MLTATITYTGDSFAVILHPTGQHPATSGEATETTEGEVGPSPIVPELKELAWTSGAFVVFALLMRYVLYPRMRKGMDSRYAKVRGDHETADKTRIAAKTEVGAYEAELAGVRAEAAARIDAVRSTLEGERAERLAVVNAEINTKRTEAIAAAEAARAAMQSQVETAVSDVASTAIRLAVGRAPDPAVVQRVVADVMSAGVAR